MNSVDKTENCILSSGRISCKCFQYVNTLFRSLMSQDIENQQIKSLKYNDVTHGIATNYVLRHCVRVRRLIAFTIFSAFRRYDIFSIAI